jgi:hypothetical protein
MLSFLHRLPLCCYAIDIDVSRYTGVQIVFEE